MLCRTIGLVAALALVACSNSDDGVTPKPDTASSAGVGGAGGATSTGGASATSGSGGGGAGDGDDEGQAGFVSGSRLQAQFYEGGDGSKIYTGMWDSQLETQCAAKVHLDDNSIRCLPVSLLTEVRYLDAGCTQPMTWRPTSPNQVFCDPPKYAVRRIPTAECILAGENPAHHHVHLVGATIPKPSQVWIYFPSNNTCSPQPVTDAPEYYSLGPAMPATDFVQLTPSLD
jgi:hypothetical protein